MSAIEIALAAFLVMIGGAAVGMMIGHRLPDHHLESNSKDVVRLAMAMIATMTALVLGLVTGSAKATFDNDDAAVKHTAASLIALDRELAAYGTETRPIREALRTTATAKVDNIWTDERAEVRKGVMGTHGGEKMLDAIVALTPATDAQKWYQGRALDVGNDIVQTRWFVFNGSERSVPTAFLVVIICWLTLLFGSFGLFAPRNATVIAALVLCALSVSGAVFLILEMDDPFSGVMRISDAPVRYAIEQMGQ